MKTIKIALLISGMALSLASVAQENEIIHTILNKHAKGMIINFDNDEDTRDLRMSCHAEDYVPEFEFTNLFFVDSIGMWCHSPWLFCWRANYGDTITPQLNWTAWGDIFFYVSSDETFYSPIRHTLPDGSSCYGWIHYRVYGQSWDLSSCWVDFYDYAYCTEPGYPLRVGQTNYEWTAVDQTDMPKPTIYPNPTEGVFTVSGKDLKEVEVFNALGQRIHTKLINGGTANINLESQPAGIYFVNVTDQNGKRCVKKIVKE